MFPHNQSILKLYKNLQMYQLRHLHHTWRYKLESMTILVVVYSGNKQSDVAFTFQVYLVDRELTENAQSYLSWYGKHQISNGNE